MGHSLGSYFPILLLLCSLIIHSSLSADDNTDNLDHILKSASVEDAEISKILCPEPAHAIPNNYRINTKIINHRYAKEKDESVIRSDNLDTAEKLADVKKDIHAESSVENNLKTNVGHSEHLLDVRIGTPAVEDTKGINKNNPNLNTNTNIGTGGVQTPGNIGFPMGGNNPYGMYNMYPNMYNPQIPGGGFPYGMYNPNQFYNPEGAIPRAGNRLPNGMFNVNPYSYMNNGVPPGFGLQNPYYGMGYNNPFFNPNPLALGLNGGLPVGPPGLYDGPPFPNMGVGPGGIGVPGLGFPPVGEDFPEMLPGNPMGPGLEV